MWTKAVLMLVFSGCLCRSIDEQVVEREVLNVVELNATEIVTSGQRIIGGVSTNIERYPYTVQVLQNNQLSCGGSLLTTRTVLSAGHCFVDDYGNLLSYRLFSIRAGSSILHTGGQTRSVSRVIPHPQYNIPLRDNDIAILVLASRVTLSASVGLAAIPSQGAVVPTNASVVHVGWGRTNPNVAALSNTLQEVTIYTVSYSDCASIYSNLGAYLGQMFLVTNNMICAGVLGVGGRDACQGDSGGPLIYNGIVVGVTSWGYGCAEPWYPGVNARVASYTSWINATVAANGAGVAKASAVILLCVSLISALRLR